MKIQDYKRKSLSQTKPGDYIQAGYRPPDDATPPPLFYRGSTVNRMGGGISINLLCLLTLKWRSFGTTHQICDNSPEITDEQRLSVIPFLQDEPPVDMNFSYEEDEWKKHILGTFPSSGAPYGGMKADLAIFDELKDVDPKELSRLWADIQYGKMTVASTPHGIVKVDAV